MLHNSKCKFKSEKQIKKKRALLESRKNITRWGICFKINFKIAERENRNIKILELIQNFMAQNGPVRLFSK